MANPAAISESTVRGIKQVIQDFVAPEIRDLKGEIGKINTRIDGLEKLMDTRFIAMREQMDAQSRILLAALGEIKALIGESRAQSERDTYRLIGELSERVKALEVKAA